MGVYPLIFCSNGDIGQTRPREAPARAPVCLISDALTSCPQTLPSTHTLFFSSTLFVLTGPRRTRGLRDHPYLPHVGGVCPRKSTKIMYYPRVTILSPHLTKIILLHDHVWQPQKQVQTHGDVTVYNSPNSPRAEQQAVASGRDRFLRKIIHQEENSI